MRARPAQPPQPLGAWPRLAAVGLAALLSFGLGGCRRAPRPAPEPEPRLPTALETLPYAAWVPVRPGDGHRRGVVRHDARRAHDGLTLFSPRAEARAYLLATDGRIVHTWEDREHSDRPWMHVRLTPAGELAVVVSDDALEVRSWSSDLVWRRELRAHHDAAQDLDGSWLVLERADAWITAGGRELPVLREYLTSVSASGEVTGRLSLTELLLPLVAPAALAAAERFGQARALGPALRAARPGGPLLLEDEGPADLLHPNTIQVIDRAVPGVASRGDVLLAVRNLDLIAVLDRRARRIVWSFGPGELEWPHHPTLLPGGNLLIFDNGVRRVWSRVLELDPRTKTIVWEYHATPKDAFFSRYRGSAQRLPNGNTLVMESDRGRGLEVTRAGDVVWEYLAPTQDNAVTRRVPEWRQAVYRLERILDAPRLAVIRERLARAPGPRRGPDAGR